MYIQLIEPRSRHRGQVAEVIWPSAHPQTPATPRMEPMHQPDPRSNTASPGDRGTM